MLKFSKWWPGYLWRLTKFLTMLEYHWTLQSQSDGCDRGGDHGFMPWSGENWINDAKLAPSYPYSVKQTIEESSPKIWQITLLWKEYLRLRISDRDQMEQYHIVRITAVKGLMASSVRSSALSHLLGSTIWGGVQSYPHRHRETKTQIIRELEIPRDETVRASNLVFFREGMSWVGSANSEWL